MEHLIQLIGRFHPLLVHLPIGILLFAVGMEFLARKRKYHQLTPTLPFLWGVGFVTAVLSCFAGYALKIEGGYEGSTVDLHQYMGISLALTAGFVFFSKVYVQFRKLQLPLAVLAAFLLIGTGHFGGNLTHGEEFLTEPVMALWGKEARKPITDINTAIVYHDLIVPVLEQKCYQCHNGAKQKGELRLDRPEHILKGGENGHVLVAGNAAESEMVRRLLLPEHHDDHMPPKGKPQLTEEEIGLIEWWISKAGADFNKTVAQVPQEEEIKVLLAHFTAGGAEAEKKTGNSSMEIPAIEVAQAKPEDVDALQKLGVVLTPLDPNKSLMAVNLINVAHFTDEHLDALLKLEEQIIWLDLSGTDITDLHLQQIGRFRNLTRLSLDNTPITDKGLASMKTLENLMYLNLYGTNITDKGIQGLGNCKKLKSLYLWLTKVTPEGVAALQQSLGNRIEINHGSENGSL